MHLLRCRWAEVLLLAVALAGCVTPSDEDRYIAVADMPELMAHVLEPNAQVFWSSVGWIIDSVGEHEIRPESNEDWLAVENAAFVVAEAGNLLMMDGRALDDGPWMTMSEALIDIGRRAVEVAEQRNEQAIFDVGAEMYFVCTQCHATYALETLRPSDNRAQTSDEGS